MSQTKSIFLPIKSQHAFIDYYKRTKDVQASFRSNLRERFAKIDKSYQRETDKTEEQQRAKRVNEAGDPKRYQNITVPVVMPHVETAVTYQTSVFLTGHPIFGVVAEPEYIEEALQLESIIDENAVRGGWVRHLMMFFRDGFKYNFAPLEVTWDKEVTPAIETVPDAKLGNTKVKEVIWAGNAVRRLDPYNVFVDPRVPATEVYKDGEFAGYDDLVSRIKLKEIITKLESKLITNIKPAFNSGKGTYTDYYIPHINNDISTREPTADFNWLKWASLDDALAKGLDYKDTYELTTLYCKVLPAEFGLKVPKSKTPQVYKLLIVNHEHIIYCERQTNAHGYLPILVGVPREDGLRYQTKSLAKDVEPFQYVASSFMNSIISSRRRAITDRVIYDPSRISAANINSSNPAAKIPVRPAAYGKPISDAVYQFPYREDQAQFSMTQIQQLMGLSNQLVGQNQASQGQFVKGNKTLKEFESVMQNASGKDQMASILLEAQVFVPLKEILKINILQYQGGTSIYNRNKKVSIEVDPIKLRKAVLNFKISDGLIPSEKLLNSETFAVALQVFGSNPQLAANYNMGPLFSYFMKTQGSEIDEFEKSPEQVAYEQALQAWQMTAQLLIEKGGDPSTLPPQPLPQQYGYNPKNNTPSPEEADNEGEGNQPQQMIQGALNYGGDET